MGQDYSRKCFAWRYTIHPAWCAGECWFSLWLVLESHNPVYSIYVMILLSQLLDQIFWRRICMNHVVLNGFCFMSLVFVREPQTNISERTWKKRTTHLWKLIIWLPPLAAFLFAIIWVSLDNSKVDKVRCGNPTNWLGKDWKFPYSNHKVITMMTTTTTKSIILERIESFHILITKSLLRQQPQQKALSYKKSFTVGHTMKEVIHWLFCLTQFFDVNLRIFITKEWNKIDKKGIM